MQQKFIFWNSSIENFLTKNLINFMIRIAWNTFYNQFRLNNSFSWFEESLKMNEKKTIINIKRLNKIIVIDFYFLSLQFDIIVLIIECKYIIVINIARFFHQWLIRYKNKNKFIIVSHYGQKQFNVIVMKFKNFFSYV